MTITRPSVETRDFGFGAKTTAGVSDIKGHMQPLSPKELRNLPPGQSHLEWFHIWTLTEIFVDDRITDGTAATVTVQRVEHWKEGPFWHGHGVKVTDTRKL